jgi:hypothetical protein
VCALVEATLVADDLARIESRTSPTRGLGLRAIETPATKVLCLLGGSIIGVLDRKTVMRKIGHGVHAARGGWTIKAGL